MPYVITINEPFNAAEHVHRSAFTRRAVATLEGSDPATLLEPLRGRMDGRAWVDLANAIRSLPESGGTIGPLPDGTVIEVQRVVWNWIIGVAEDLGAEIEEDATNAEMIDAFNEAQARA